MVLELGREAGDVALGQHSHRLQQRAQVRRPQPLRPLPAHLLLRRPGGGLVGGERGDVGGTHDATEAISPHLEVEVAACSQRACAVNPSSQDSSDVHFVSNFNINFLRK